MKHDLYCSACPICGHYRVKGKPNSQITYNCPKCGQLLDIKFDELGYHVQIVMKDAEKDEKTIKYSTP